MHKDRGTADIVLLVVMLGGTLIPAIYAIGPPHWLDTLAGQMVLYGGAIAVAVTGWRKARRGLAYARHGWSILLSLDRRVRAIEEILGALHLEVRGRGGAAVAFDVHLDSAARGLRGEDR